MQDGCFVSPERKGMVTQAVGLAAMDATCWLVPAAQESHHELANSL